MSRQNASSMLGNIVGSFAALAVTIGIPMGIHAWSTTQNEEAARIKPLSDNAYSPQRLKECDDNNAQRAAQGKPAQLCMPDLVIPVRPDGKTIDFIELNPPAQ